MVKTWSLVKYSWLHTKRPVNNFLGTLKMGAVETS